MAITVGNRWPVEASDETSGGLRSALWTGITLHLAQAGAASAGRTARKTWRLADSRRYQAACATGGVIPSTMRTSPLRKPPDNLSSASDSEAIQKACSRILGSARIVRQLANCHEGPSAGAS